MKVEGSGLLCILLLVTQLRSAYRLILPDAVIESG